jgi:NAD(P)-dependent dehydrogenase (short-subunit alcohol dehydrogenase family)
VVALITGASGSIGRAIARRLAADGFQLALTGRRLEALDALRDELAKELKIDAMSIAIELTDHDAVSDGVEAVCDTLGQVDVLVNSAGGWSRSHLGGFTDKTAEELEAEVADNLLSTVFVCRAVLPGMARQGYGRIINIASVAGIIGLEGHAAYSAAKAGHIGLTRQLAVEFGPAGVTTNCVAPGAVLTELMAELIAKQVPAIMALLEATPTGKLTSPAQVADLVAFLAASEAGQVNGQTIAIDGGMSVA